MRKVSISFLFSSFILTIALATGLYCVQDATSEPNGITGCSRTGCTCHSPSASSQTSVTIWSDSSHFTAGKTYIFHIAIRNSAGSIGGCDISADNSATLGVSSSGLQLLGKELTHSSPGSFHGDSLTWAFKYTTPPKAVSAHIYAAGNAFSSGEWNTTVDNITIEAAAGPQIVVPSSVTFKTETGDTLSEAITIKNNGTATLTISGYSLKTGSVFSLVDTSAKSVAAKDSIHVRVLFSPNATGGFSDVLHVLSNDGTTPNASITLSGTGLPNVLYATPNPVQFGNLPHFTSDTMRLVLRDTGRGAITIPSLTITGAGSSSFAVVSSIPPITDQVTLQPGDSIVLLISLTASTGTRATLSASLTGGGTTVQLTGQEVDNAGVADNASAQTSVTIFPNPSNGRFAIGTTKSGDANISISDAGGRVVANQSVILSNETPFDFSMLPNGTYFIRIQPQTGEGTVSRIVIQR